MHVEHVKDADLRTYLAFAGELADLAAKVTLPRFRNAEITVAERPRPD